MIGDIDSFSGFKAPGFVSSASPGGDRAGLPLRGLRQPQKVAEEFASLLLLEVLKAMRATLSEGGLFAEDSSSHEMYTSLADTEVARALAKRDGLGLGAFILQGMKTSGQEMDPRPLPSHISPVSPVTARSPSLSTPQFPIPSGQISSAFGLRADPLEGEARFHAGVDIAAPAGSPVQAVAAGRVVFSGRAGEYGNLVTVDHGNGLTTRYAHNGANLVSEGQRVEAGQEIALVGTSGRSTGPHLHFEVRKNGDPLNPQPFLSRKQS